MKGNTIRQNPKSERKSNNNQFKKRGQHVEENVHVNISI